MKNSIFKFIFVISAMVLISGCTETQLVTDWMKKATRSDTTREQRVAALSSTADSRLSTTGAFKIGRPYKVAGIWYTPKESYSYDETGIASWYGPNFHGKRTANGEVFNMNDLTAAHPTLQIPSLVRVTNLSNGRSIVLRINDRGPFKRGRLIDVSKRGAELLGFATQGTARVRVQVLPKESRMLAEAAKTGRPTQLKLASLQEQPSRNPANWPTAEQPREVDAPVDLSSADGKPMAMPRTKTIESQPLDEDVTTVPGHNEDGRFMPDPVVTEEPVIPTNIYVQVGSFTDPNNAQNLLRRLSHMGAIGIYQAMVDGQSYSRVRIGPMHSVEQADAMLDKMIVQGFTTSHIVVDQ